MEVNEDFLTFSQFLQWEKKGFRIGIYSTYEKGEHQWVGCVRIGDDSRLTFPEKEEGCRNASFKSPENALKACIELCKNYVPSKKKIIEEVVYKQPVKKSTKKK